MLRKSTLAALTFVVASCGAEPATLLLDAERDERLSEREAQMAITLIGTDEGEYVATAADVAESVRLQCQGELSLGWEAFDLADPSACKSGLVADVFVNDCVAQRLLEASEADTPTTYEKQITIGGGAVQLEAGWIMPPQLPESRIALARRAALTAQETITTAGDTLRYQAGQDASTLNARVSTCDIGGSNPPPGTLSTSPLRAVLSVAGYDAGVTPLALIAEVLVGSTVTLERAAQVEIRNQIAVAEAERSRSSSAITASEMGWVDPVMSRGTLAKHLIGGSHDGLFGYEEGEGVCPVPPPEGDTIAAIEHLRAIGGDTRRLLDLDVELSDLLLAGADPLGVRIGAMLGSDEPVDSVDELESLTGVSVRSFDAARNYMRHEARAFVTQPTAIDGGIPLSPDALGERSLDAWASTLRPPRPPPSAYAVAAARFGGNPVAPNDGLLLGNPVTATYAQRAVAHTLDYAYAVATDFGVLVSGTEPEVDPPTDPPTSEFLALPDDALVRLRTLAEIARERVPARVQFCNLGTKYSFETFHRPTDFVSDASDILVVHGVSGLRCAVEGQIQGEECDLSSHELARAAGVGTLGVRHRTSGIRSYISGTFTTPTPSAPADDALPQEIADDELVFVLRRVRGAAPGGPGDFESLASHRIDSSDTGCTMYPVVPQYIEQVHDILTPSTVNCATTEVTCAGPAYADLIPLENEITGDDGGRGLENSWQYWLSLAEESANHADRLGEDLLTSGEALDEGIESIEDAVSEICGGTVNLRDAFFDQLSEPPAGPCSGGGACAMGYECSDGNCVRSIDDLLAGPEYNNLRECIGDNTVIDYVAAGTRPLCVWKLDTDGPICDRPDDDTTTHPCPWIATVVGEGVDAVASCTAMGALPTGATIQDPITNVLGIFETEPPPIPAEPQGPFDCNLIRELRTAGTDRERLARLVIASKQFSRTEMTRIARKVGYVAFPDDYGRITVGNHRWRGLGSPQDPGMAGEVTEWPCGRDSGISCSNPLDPSLGNVTDPEFFCASTTACGATEEAPRIQRAYMNQRMARAVITLRLLTGQDLNQVELPYRPEPYWLSSEADTERVRSENPYNELKKWRWNLNDGHEPVTLRGSRELVAANGVSYYVEEDDGIGQNVSTLELEGRVYCTAEGSGPGWTWTRFDNMGEHLINPVGSPFPSFHRIYTPCNHEDSLFVDEDDRTPSSYYMQPPGSTQAVLYTAFTEANADPDVDAIAVLWRGMGGEGIAVDPGFRSAGSVRLGSLTTALFYDGVIENGPDCRWSGDGYQCDRGRYSNYRSAGPNQAERYNDIAIMEDGIHSRDFIDALELACEVQTEEFNDPAVGEVSNCDDWDALLNDSMSNLRQAQKMASCLAEELEQRGQMQIFQSMPEAAIANLTGTATPAGERGAELEIITTQLRDLAQYPEQSAYVLEQIALELQRARLAAGRNDVRADLNAVNRRSTQFREVTSCIASTLRSAAGGLGLDPVAAGGSGLHAAAAVADCANSIAQVAFARLQEDLQNQLADNETETELSRSASALSAHINNLKDLNRSAANAQNLLRGSLSRLESNREAVLREITDALTTFGSTSAVSTIRRRRFNTLEERYDEAHERSIGTAWLARRALEQRLGRNLSSMVDDLPLVDAPNRWADELCVMGGMNYQQIARDYTIAGGDSYAREYVGDYVRRLRSVFDSYSVAHPFVTGDDTAVVSLRNDVVNARAECTVPVRNLLAWSSELATTEDPSFVAPIAEADAPPVDRTAPPVWEHVGCVPQTVTIDDEGVPIQVDRIDGCIGFERLDDPAFAPTYSEGALGAPNGWRIRFGGPGRIAPPATSYAAGVHIAQRVTVQGGTYRLSWRGRTVATDGIDPSTAFTVHDAEGVELPHVRMATALPADGWDVYYLFFTVGSEQEVDVVIQPNDLTGAFATSAMYLEVAAPMLENATRELGLSTGAVDPMDHTYPPFPYIETREAGVASLPVCEDQTGEVFRTHWERGCTTLCAGGGEGCTDGRRACFWELPFTISQHDLEYGGQLAHAGFANGNYNYRWNTLSANVVGAGVRDCEDSMVASSCFGSGFVPVSLYHDGDFKVRNHWGELYDAPLFRGRMEHARALNADRYLTNPISSADRALVEPYTRYEMRGRPLAGRYRFRVWDEPGIEFSRIEDVQVVLGYRYWTRLN